MIRVRQAAAEVVLRRGLRTRVASKGQKHSMRRRRSLILGAVILVMLAASAPWIGLRVAAHGHEHWVAAAPSADVVIVLGTAVLLHTGEPSARLAGRLLAAADLVKAGRARVVLVSGDGHGVSGNEPATMINFLVTQGIRPQVVVADPYGLDTYDSCARARQVYGVTRALIVTQAYHLARAVTICRRLGVDVEGVYADCKGCTTSTLVYEQVRDFFAAGKALWDMARNRPPAVSSPPDFAVSNALEDFP